MTAAEVRSTARERGMIAGQTDEAIEKLGWLAEQGVQEVQFQHLDFDNDEFPEYLGSDIAPQVRDL